MKAREYNLLNYQDVFHNYVLNFMLAWPSGYVLVLLSCYKTELMMFIIDRIIRDSHCEDVI